MPFIYCLSNPAMPELLKIGAVHMNDKTVKDRADELFTTGVPAEFRVELFTEIEDSRGVERKIHAILDSYRVNSSREFFRISPENVQKILAEKSYIAQQTFKKNHRKEDIFSALPRAFPLSSPQRGDLL